MLEWAYIVAIVIIDLILLIFHTIKESNLILKITKLLFAIILITIPFFLFLYSYLVINTKIQSNILYIQKKAPLFFIFDIAFAILFFIIVRKNISKMKTINKFLFVFLNLIYLLYFSFLTLSFFGLLF